MRMKLVEIIRKNQHVKWCELMSVFYRYLSGALMEPPSTPSASHTVYLWPSWYRPVYSRWGCLWSHISHTTSELSPIESSMFDEELDGNWWKVERDHRFGVSLLYLWPLSFWYLMLWLFVLSEVFLFCWVFLLSVLKMFQSQKNWTYSCVHPLALEVLSLCIPCPILVFAFVDPS